MKPPVAVRDVAGRDKKSIVATLLSQTGTTTPSSHPAFDQINPKWTWHYRALLKWRERLLAECQTQLRAAAQPLEPHNAAPADSATDEFDHNVALDMLSAKQETLHEIDAALHRIHTGMYGVCEATSEPISGDRLRAIPWTRFAQATEARHEAAGKIRPPHLGRLGVIRSLRIVGRLTDALADLPSDELKPET